MGTVHRMGLLLAWLGKLFGTAFGGPGIAVLGDPGLEPQPSVSRRTRWAYRILPVVVALAFFWQFGVPWTLLVAVAVIVLVLPPVVSTLRATWKRNGSPQTLMGGRHDR